MAFNINNQVVSLLGLAFPGVGNLATVKSALTGGYFPPLFHRKAEGTDFGQQKTYQKSKEYASSFLGTPLFFPMKIDGVLLPNEPLITVTGTKRVVETAIAGNDFSVTEIVGLENYKINIKGVATNYDPINGKSKNDFQAGLVYDDYPEEWLYLLNDLFKRKRSEKTSDTISLPVECDFLRILGIHYIVIKQLNLPAVAGMQSAIPYEFTCMSDTHIELVLNK
jgi:Domain of unknown function (DUF6046)